MIADVTIHWNDKLKSSEQSYTQKPLGYKVSTNQWRIQDFP